MFADMFLTLLALLAVVFLLWAGWIGRTLQVALDLPLLDTSVDLDPLLFERLQSVRGASVTDAAHGRYTQTIRRVPLWAIVGMLVTLPVGLLFLLVRTDQSLHVSVVPAGAGKALRVTGVTEAYIWRRTCRALAPLLDAGSVPEPERSGSFLLG